ncbi:hypothetical protein ASG43_04885 [Aureimonas sp. Leaf454]|uniref:TonB-dependent receptor n=1 Tax=Aureimonas sp. Leaf454 TaxID=1736381 RepID=UPI0006F6ED3F|nr:TonB-dependent siderophore receptor [Aureimonas sp. Leaf454]KQT54879.1 hypothetical protein ASG43_04885 [Aureimonas sp. Leaf454]
MHKPFTSLRPTLSQATLAAGMALTLGTPAAAQSAAPAATDGQPILLDTITLDGAANGTASRNANRSATGISRLPATVQETPRIVNVVPEKVLEEQNVTTLEQALRNVPGITISSGEGNGGQNGDQFRIRGVQSRGDIYVDGLRDFGAYVRDSFNLEAVQVYKGPNGESFGTGTAGGLVNQQTKQARLGSFVEVEGTVGSGPTYRGTFDVNREIDETTAVRVNGVVHEQDVVDRDNIRSDRQGIAASVAFGIQQPTSLTLDYFYQHTDRVPDFGVPFVFRPDGTASPLTEFGVRRDISYARDLDMDEADVHALTSRFQHEIDDRMVFNNDTRLTIYDRDFSSTNPACGNDANTTLAGIQYAGSCSQLVLAGGDPRIGYGAGGGMTYFQEGWGIQNVSTLKSTFETGVLRHELLVGLDLYHQEDTRYSGLRTPSVTAGLNPQFIKTPYFDVPNAAITKNKDVFRDSTAADVAVFASDRVWFTDEISVMGSARWDNFESTFQGSGLLDNVQQSQTSSEVSPSATIFYEPTPDTTLYATYARSYVPVGANISFQVTNGTAETPNNAIDLEPEKSDLYEIGAKVNVFDGALGVTGAIFRIDKDNAIYTDESGAVTFGFAESGQGRRIEGVELGVTGEITTQWDVTLAYAYLDGEVTSASDASLVGKRANNLPEHNLSLWTAYDVTPHLDAVIPGKLEVGGGIFYASDYVADSANIATVPETFSLDARISYEIENIKVSLNGYNLSDELNYSAAFNSARAVPASGRSFLASVAAKF